MTIKETFKDQLSNNWGALRKLARGEIFGEEFFNGDQLKTVLKHCIDVNFPELAQGNQFAYNIVDNQPMWKENFPVSLASHYAQHLQVANENTNLLARLYCFAWELASPRIVSSSLNHDQVNAFYKSAGLKTWSLDTRFLRMHLLGICWLLLYLNGIRCDVLKEGFLRLYSRCQGLPGGLNHTLIPGWILERERYELSLGNGPAGDLPSVAIVSQYVAAFQEFNPDSLDTEGSLSLLGTFYFLLQLRLFFQVIKSAKNFDRRDHPLFLNVYSTNATSMDVDNYLKFLRCPDLAERYLISIQALASSPVDFQSVGGVFGLNGGVLYYRYKSESGLVGQILSAEHSSSQVATVYSVVSRS